MGYEFLRGINFDSPATFTCMGKNYLLDVAFISFEKESTKMQIQHLDVSTIASLEWTNEANNLCLGGKLTLVSTNGKFGNFFNATPAFVGVNLELFQNAIDSMKDGDFSPSKKSANSEKFEHIFIVDKYGIEERDKNTVVYNIFLKSTMWSRMISRASFSNCNGEEPKNIYEIIRKILVDAFLDFEVLKGKKLNFTSSFEKINSGENAICYPYITFANDSVFDAIRFLQSRLYFAFRQGGMASGLSYLRYDEFKNSVSVVDFDGKLLPEEGILDGSLIALDAQTFEQFVSGKEQQYTSLNNLGFLSFIMNFFGYASYAREFPTEDNSGNVEDKVINVLPEQLSKFYNQKETKFEEEKKFDLAKMKNFLFGANGLFPEYLDYKNEYSTSNLYDGTFQQMLEVLKNRDIMIFETNGKFGHVPGMLFYVSGKTKPDSGSFGANAKKESEDILNKNITGVFHVLKTVHIIQPNNQEGEMFREKLYLAKTWTPKG